MFANLSFLASLRVVARARNLFSTAAAGAVFAVAGSASAVIVIVPTTTPFIDISGTGTSIGTIADDSENNILMSSLTSAGFTGNALLGTSVSNGAIRVGNNGGFLWGGDTASSTSIGHSEVGFTNADILTMAASNTSSAGNGGLPGGTGIEQFLCPHWDDLTPGTSGGETGSIYWQVLDADSDGQVDDLVIMWSHEDHFSASGTGTITFEAIVYSTANSNGPFVDFVYQDTSFIAGASQNDGASASIGYKNWGVVAFANDLKYSFNTAAVAGYVAAQNPALPHALRIAVPLTLSGSGTATPNTGVNTSTTATHLGVSLAPGGATGTTVTIDLSTLGGSASNAMFDDGAHGDGVAGDLVFGLDYNVPSGLSVGNRNLPWTATSTNVGNTSGTIAFGVIAPPATVFDFGDMSVPNAQSQTFNLAAAEIKWFKFNLTTAADSGLGTFVDMDTHGSSGCPDTEIGVYRADGTLVVSDDDSGAGTESLLSFGAGTRLPRTDGACGTGNAYAGANGNLVAGTYYIAAGKFNVAFNPTAWSVTSTAPAGSVLSLNVRSIPLSTNPTGTGSATPSSLRSDLGGTTVVAVNVTPGTSPTSSGIAVTADASGAGGSSAVTLHDDGVVPDAVAGDNVFTAGVAIPAGGSVGSHPIGFLITDGQGRSSTGAAAFSIVAPPSLSGAGVATPDPVVEGNAVTLTVDVTPAGGPLSTGIGVVVDATSVSGGSVVLRDDGVAPDAVAGDNIFSGMTFAAPPALGLVFLPFSVTDAQARSFAGTIVFTVMGSPTGACCNSDGSCTIERQFVCVGGLGSFAGPGVSCGGPGYLAFPGAGGVFEDISLTGTPLTGAPGDDNAFGLALPFVFPFYGTPFASVSVCTNGFLQFGATDTTFTNVPIPNSAIPNAMLAVLWDDFTFGTNAGDSLTAETRGTSGIDLRVIVQWTGVAQFRATPNTDFNTFQCVLFEDGRIAYRYDAIATDFAVINGDAGGATVGIEDATGSGLSTSIGSGATPVDPGSSILFTFGTIPNPCNSPCSNAPKILEQIDFSQMTGHMLSQEADCVGCLVVPRSYACLDDFEINGLEGAPPGPPTLVGIAEALVINSGPAPLRWRVNIYTSRTIAEADALGDQYHEEFLTPTCAVPNYTPRFPGFDLVTFDLGTGFNQSGSRVLSAGRYWLSVVAVTTLNAPNVLVGLGDLLDPNLPTPPNAFRAVYRAQSPDPGGDTGSTTKNAAYRLRTQGACPADFNLDSVVNPDDLADYITCFFEEASIPGTCPLSDYNHDGNIDPDDLGDFITGYFGGVGACAP